MTRKTKRTRSGSSSVRKFDFKEKNMSLDLEIQALLRSPQVQEINFTMRGIRVTGAGFAELSTCFSDHTIRHRIRVTVRQELVGPHALAAYHPDTDRICLRSNAVLQTAIGRSHVIHECTHAQLDLRRLSTPIRSEEAAAFIAETWYLLASGVSEADIDQSVGSNIRTITTELRTRAQATGGVVEVSAAQINEARFVMAGFRVSSGHYRSDGIRGHVYRGA